MSYDTTTTVTNDVTDNLALYHNEFKTAIDHLMSAAAYAAYVNAQSMTGNVTLVDGDFPIQSFSPTAARNLTLPAVASTNHAFYVINRSGTYAITVKNAGATTITTIQASGSALILSDGTNNWYAVGGGGLWGSITGTLSDQSDLDKALNAPDGTMKNGKIDVTVASNNITVAIKTLAGANPSASDPVYVWIKGVKRTITAALSVTKNAATNWFNSGGSELATKEVDYFVYLLWNTTPGTDIVDLGFARIPHGRVYSDFSGTTTNEKYLAFANASTPTSTDDCVNIGRFAATLSAGAGYTWTVPTFTSANLIQHPIYITRWLDFSPQWSGLGSMTVTSVTETRKKYQVSYDNCEIDVVVSAFTIGGTPSSLIYTTLPFSSLVTTFPLISGGVPITDAGGGDMGYLRCDGTVTRSAWAKRTGSNYTAGAGTFLAGKGSYQI